MNYRYVGYNLDEGVVRGRIEADNEATVRDQVSEMGYKLLEVKAMRQLPGIEDLFPSLFKIKHKDLVTFTQQLAIMVRGGGNLQRALELLEEETRNRILKRILGSIIKSLDEGGSLSAAVG
jgi:type IV pilus assembly protein PilC